MILTGNEIQEEILNGNINLEPFNKSQINPNSYNYKISNEIAIPLISEVDGKTYYNKTKIPKEGIILEPHTTYLSHTLELIGSKKYAMSLIGRSSLGRLGLFLQVSANLGHTKSSHNWTLEIVACKRFIIYPYMIIGQVSFWVNYGDYYDSPIRYNKYNFLMSSLD